MGRFTNHPNETLPKPKCMTHMKTTPTRLLHKPTIPAILLPMRIKQITTVIFLVSVMVLAGCGSRVQEAEPILADITLPVSCKITNTQMLEDGSMYLTGIKDEKNLVFKLNEDTKIFFDDDMLNLFSLSSGQKVYLEGETSANIKTVIITNWPGIQSRGALPVRNPPESVVPRISEFLETNHPELGITKDSSWTPQEDSQYKLPSGRFAKLFRRKQLLMMVRWTEHEFPIYNVIVTPNLNDQAIWSGQLNEYSEIEENHYEAPKN